MGVELLRKMGWKDGQGVGPRVKRKALRQKEGRFSLLMLIPAMSLHIQLDR